MSRARIGLLFDVRNPVPWARPWPELLAGTLDLVVEAERQGADAIWATEHHGFEDGYLSQPLTFLAAAAARTSRVRLGTGVLLAALRHPRHVSEQAALVDNLSDGRLELGVGAGYAPTEFATFGRDLGRRMSLADQSIRDLRSDLWDGRLRPPPVQARVPLWLGYQGPQGARRAGRLGVGLLSPDPRLLAPYREGLAEGGHPADTAAMGGLVPLVLSSDPERTARRLAPHYAHQTRTYAGARHSGGEPVPPASPEDLDALVTTMLDPSGRGLRVVTVDAAVRELGAVLDAAPIRHLYFWATVAAMPEDLVHEHLALTLGRLAPRLRAR
ncbi:LLM class flavin-dependent oxidoreductase [Nocardioides sp. L-11A]|uniref:LLM class flavin-dependent oxidoreductase n=1 Tax=Nocardioides sp. L-11A TaxID=3043848 RepID=UPI00249AE53E|nr:LLM class flavin-dependent oxidoreductase [Nocardioides sp. L-11A]